MAKNYSIDVCRQLEAAFEDQHLHRPLRVAHYEAGTELSYTVQPVAPGPETEIRLRVERFVGGGFAGQVYRVEILAIIANGQAVQQAEGTGLTVGGRYAMKILIPPSGFSLLFRNAIYAVGFQGPFQLQVNPVAARAGALWQKFIRAAAQERFGDPLCVNDIHATFVDTTLGSCGELSDWVEGRTWRLEVDDRLDMLRRWRKKKTQDDSRLGSPEYRAKYRFMTTFVALLHEMGAHEFARQYEWTTCKSQPNCLKRQATHGQPEQGLIAVDFRAGLALLPFLPMSPGDFKLIVQGIKRGSLVQFDRGDLATLEGYLKIHPQVAQQLPQAERMLTELKDCERLYRDSLPDITHNHVRLLSDARLWRTIFDSAVGGWRVRNLIDADKAAAFRNSRVKTFLFFLLGLLPILGRVGRKVWAKADWRRHYGAMLHSMTYFKRAVCGRIYEGLIGWHRAGRVSAERAMLIRRKPIRYFGHLPFSILPAGLHRSLTDWAVFKDTLHYLFVRPFRLYFDAPLREQWLRDMVQQGRNKNILSDDDANTILSQLNEPYIQKYLVSLVVHLMTLPVTQVVSVAVAAYFYWTHPDMPQAERAAAVAGILVLFQVIPISPGSFCRGLYTTYMAIHDRNFKDYNIALFLSYFKYVGYLAFPIQMTYRYPSLARFMASHWATDAVHIVPVFGERGALLEHWVFCLCYNWPLTIRRRMANITDHRAKLAVRLWHLPAAVLTAAAIFILAHWGYHLHTGHLPGEENVWFVRPLFCLFFFVPLAAGWAATYFAGGLTRGKRILAAAGTGLTAALLYSLAAFGLEHTWEMTAVPFVVPLIWRCFVLTVFAAIGAFVTEMKLPDPEMENSAA